MRTAFALALSLSLLLAALPASAVGSATTAGPVGAADAAALDGSPPVVGGVDEHDDVDACGPVSDDQRPAPDTDELGWVNGCYHDEAIHVTVEDGLNETEVDATVARTMARVEHIRQLPFRETPPVEVLTRSEFQSETERAFANASAAQRLHQNVKHEALFFVGQDEDAIEQIRGTRGASVLGYYDSEENRIVLVSESEDAVLENLTRQEQLTLAHELVHALQDQHFNLTRYDRRTTEENNAVSGLVEGEASYVEYLYEQRCDGEWECLGTTGETEPELPPNFHWGLWALSFQPYNDGPALIQAVREEGGWEAVDEMYENPPAATEQVIHPARYPDEEPRNVTVEDRSSDRWHVPDVGGGVDYVEFGEAGIYSMFLYPAIPRADAGASAEIVSLEQFVNSGPSSDLSPYSYESRYSDGWDGDRLYPYATDESADTGETGYVWRLAWDTPADAGEFVAGYTRLLDAYGAEAVEDRRNTYRIPDDEPFGGAYYVDRSGDVVVIVNAPTVAALSEIRAGAAPEATPEPTPIPTTVTSPGGDDPPGGTPTDTGLPVPGLGPVLALLAAAAAAALLARRG